MIVCVCVCVCVCAVKASECNQIYWYLDFQFILDKMSDWLTYKDQFIFILCEI